MQPVWGILRYGDGPDGRAQLQAIQAEVRRFSSLRPAPRPDTTAWPRQCSREKEKEKKEKEALTHVTIPTLELLSPGGPAASAPISSWHRERVPAAAHAMSPVPRIKLRPGSVR